MMLSRQNERLVYATFDSIREGVASSQVVPYVAELSKQFRIDLMTFEKDSAPLPKQSLLLGSNVNWIPITFGRRGLWGGLYRVFLLSKVIKGAELTHARGDLACLSAVIGGCKSIIWDCRAITPEQRIEAKGKSKFSIEYLVLRFIEWVCAKRATSIIFITEKARDFMSRRYNLPRDKSQVISTCVDLSRFTISNPIETLSTSRKIRVLISGSLGPHYDEEAMAEFLGALGKIHPVYLGLAIGKESRFQPTLLRPDKFFSVSYYEMPDLIKEYDVGISIWKMQMSVSSLSVSAVKNAEFLACGKALIVNKNQGDIAEIVELENIGVSVDPSSKSDYSRLSEKLIALLRDPTLPNRCRSVAEKHYSLALGTTKLNVLYNELITNNNAESD
jgi:glycosyltransferase involved in cell wall biosynthesis